MTASSQYPNANSERNVLKYQGQNYQFVPAYVRNRDPTNNDLRDPKNQGYYPLLSMWLNKTTGVIWVLKSTSAINPNDPNSGADWDPILESDDTTLTGILTANGDLPLTASVVTQNGVLYGGPSNLVSSTAIGTSGQLLQSKGAAPPAYTVAQYPSVAGTVGNTLISTGSNFTSVANPAGTILVQSQIIANGTAEVTFSGIGSYSNYMLVVRNCYPNDTAVRLKLQISTDGVTFISTGYVSGTTSVPFNNTTWVNSNISSSFLLSDDVDSSGLPGINGTYYLYNAAGVEYTCFSGQGTFSAVGSQSMTLVSGSNTNVAAVTALKFFFSSGTFFSGRITLYGIQGS